MLWFRANSSNILTWPYWMCVQSSFYHQLWINTWRSKFEKNKQYSSCLLILWVKSHKDPDVIDMSIQRLAQCMEKHQEAVYWADIHLAIEKELTFYQTRSNATILHETLPTHCIPKVFFGWKLEKSKTRKCTCHLGLRQRSHWSTNGRENWVQNMLNNQKTDSYLEVSNRTKKIFNEFVERTGKPVITHDVITVQNEWKTSRSQKIDVNFFTKNLILQRKGETRYGEAR